MNIKKIIGFIIVSLFITLIFGGCGLFGTKSRRSYFSPDPSGQPSDDFSEWNGIYEGDVDTNEDTKKIYYYLL